MQITVTKPFKFAHLGYQVQEFEPGEVETTDEAGHWAIEHGYATSDAKAAPENKDAARKRERK